jgi:hypothetical protein
MGRVPLRHPPRHLVMSQRSGMDARQHDVAEWILAAVAIVLTAVVLVSSMFSHPNSRPGPPATDRPAAAPSTTPAPTSTVAARPPTSGPASLVRVGFEADLAGWRPIGAARIKRDPRAHQGRWAARFTGSGIADQGMALPAALQAGQGLCRQCLGAGRPASHAGRGEPAGSCGGPALCHRHRAGCAGIRRLAADRGRPSWPPTRCHPGLRGGPASGSPPASVLVDELEVTAHKASFMSSG